MHYVLYPKGVCSSKIELDVEEGRVHNIAYTGGCEGNLKALGALGEGMRTEELIKRLSGIRCGTNSTSCSDQLATLLKKASKNNTESDGLKNEQQNRY